MSVRFLHGMAPFTDPNRNELCPSFRKLHDELYSNEHLIVTWFDGQTGQVELISGEPAYRYFAKRTRENANYLLVRFFASTRPRPTYKECNPAKQQIIIDRNTPHAKVLAILGHPQPGLAIAPARCIPWCPEFGVRVGPQPQVVVPGVRVWLHPRLGIEYEVTDEHGAVIINQAQPATQWRALTAVLEFRCLPGAKKHLRFRYHH